MPRINIYSKEECDANFAAAAEVEGKADKSTTYTKTETDALMQQERFIRSQADENLQDQIDVMDAASDVKDVVGTYAELQAYDVTTLNPNDIVKVLSDSTHGGAETYYRWIVSGGVGAWQFIGSKARSYTAEETDLLLDRKADKSDTYTKLETDNMLLQKQQVLTFDTTPMLGSTNPVTSRGIKDALDLKASIADVYDKSETYSATEADALLSWKADKSTTYTKLETDGLLAAKQDELIFDNAPTAGSSNPVKSSGIKTALDAKQNTLTFDTAPTSGSSNPVTSGGILTALNTRVAKTGAQTMNGELTLTNNVTTYQEVTGMNLKNMKKSKNDTVWLAAINVIDKNGVMCARLVWEANGTGRISLQSMVLNTDGTEKWTTLNQGA